MCLQTFNALNSRGVQHLSEMSTTRNVHYGLRSHEALTLNIKWTKRESLGAAPKLWNSLPEDVRSSNDVSAFKSKLKSQYFSIAYKKNINFSH